MGSRISEECSSKCISAQKNCYLWWAMKLVMKKRSIYFPLCFFCDSRRKILVTVEEAVVKPKPLNVSNTKKRGKKCAHRWNPKRQLGFPATEKPCCLPQGIITCQVTRLNYISPCITMYTSPTNLKQTKDIIQTKNPHSLGKLIFSNTCQDFNMISRFLLLSNVPA